MGELEFEETKEVIGGLAYPANKYGIVLNEIAHSLKGGYRDDGDCHRGPSDRAGEN